MMTERETHQVSMVKQTDRAPRSLSEECGAVHRRRIFSKLYPTSIRELCVLVYIALSTSGGFFRASGP